MNTRIQVLVNHFVGKFPLKVTFSPKKTPEARFWQLWSPLGQTFENSNMPKRVQQEKAHPWHVHYQTASIGSSKNLPGGPKKRGHCTFSQISRKLLKISK